jgi:rhodanese-related sulfurtransferase
MTTFLSRLSLNQRLALLAFVLGLVAIAATPTRGPRVVIDAKSLALDIQQGGDRVDPRTLARWIIEGRTDYRLVGLLDDTEAAVPGIEAIPVGQLLDGSLERGEKILLLSEDGTRAAQARVLLQANGYKGAMIIDGGVRGWRERVVNPVLDGVPEAERATIAAMSARFGGAPRTGTAAASATAGTTPATAAAVAAPMLTPAAKAPAKPKKKEGC